jgi:signal transduction histidine kinase
MKATTLTHISLTLCSCYTNVLSRLGDRQLQASPQSWNFLFRKSGLLVVKTDLRNSEQALRALAARMQTVREDERTRIARELHDELGQALTGLKMDLSWLVKQLSADFTEPAGRIGAMFRLIDDTIQAVRRIAAGLRPVVLEDAGLAGAIRWQTRQFQARTGVRCKLDLPAEQFSMDPDRSTAVFRIFQEAMTNVARHARATNVDIRLRVEAGQLLLSVRDNGLGIPPAALRSPQALGLLGVRERALLLGGRVGINGAAGKGTRVRLSIPLRLQAGP